MSNSVYIKESVCFLKFPLLKWDRLWYDGHIQATGVPAFRKGLRRLMRKIGIVQKIIFTPEEEERFQRSVERQIRRFLWIPVGLLILFQIFNILHALIYTEFRLDTVPSRVYFCMYALMLTASLLAVGMLYVFSRPAAGERTGRILRLQYVFVVFLVAWSVAVTLYDQRVSDNISVYLVMVMSAAGLAYLPPGVFLPLYLLSEAFMIAGMPLFSSGQAGDHFGFYVNSAGMTLTSLFVSFYRYYSQRRDFKNRCIIEEKNQEIMEKSAELDFIANHDSLTGLLNRRFLIGFLHRIYQDSRQNQFLLGVYMIDIDNFKNYNDCYGHVMGDECLRRIADALGLQMDTGKLFRYGGEEFLVLKPDVRREDCDRIGEELRRCVEALKIKAADPGKVVTVSIGFSCGEARDEKGWESLLKKADSALYHAKRSGKNQVSGL